MGDLVFNPIPGSVKSLAPTRRATGRTAFRAHDVLLRNPAREAPAGSFPSQATAFLVVCKTET